MRKPPEFATDFELFWGAYPRRQAKKDALKAWRQLKPSADVVQKILNALAWQTTTKQWKQGVEFVPLPATYLRGERWEDEQPVLAGAAREVTQADRDHAARIAADRAQTFEQDKQDMAAEYYKTHPWARPARERAQ